MEGRDRKVCNITDNPGVQLSKKNDPDVRAMNEGSSVSTWENGIKRHVDFSTKGFEIHAAFPPPPLIIGNLQGFWRFLTCVIIKVFASK